MMIALVGASGSGKSEIEKELVAHHGYKKVIPYTTRKARENEENRKDYFFTTNGEFNTMKTLNLFAEWDEYPQERMYGTLKSDYVETDGVTVLTPNGLRQLFKNIPREDIFVVFVKSNLGTRMKRYIDRCGVDKFNLDDKNEISARVERDYGMFMGIEREVDLIVYNNEGTYIKSLVSDILNG